MKDADVIIVGAGASGLLAGGVCASKGLDTVIIERNETPGLKLRITGKGRCNITNQCDIPEFISSVPQNGRFLYSAISKFSPGDTIAFFEGLGLQLKTERGNRVFPQSDKASDVADSLVKFAKNNGCRFIKGRVVSLIIEDGCLKGVQISGNREFYSDAVLMCTGGKSYPKTGSTGDGYDLARRAGHAISALKPSLVPLVSQNPWCKDLAGLSLKNVSIDVFDNTKKKIIYTDFGEMLFTHFGVSGPIILSASSHMRAMSNGKYTIYIDLKPALSFEHLDARIRRDFDVYKNRDFSNSLVDLLPKTLIPVIVGLSGIEKTTKINQITREQRLFLAELLKRVPVIIAGFRPLEEAIITSGGVNVNEINPKTMESKIISNLYFAGEIIDVDGYTGGFNLQIAFSTAYLAAKSVLE